MENEITYNINLSNERFISLFNNRIEIRHNPYIINYIHNYDRNEPNRNLYDIIPMGPGLSLLATWSSISNDEIVLPSLISDDELVLPAFVEQEFLIPEDAVCGITFEKPDCCTPCGHYFCRAEITRWLKQQKNLNREMTCPSCRGLITKVSICKNIPPL
jgi:hypothetical protein